MHVTKTAIDRLTYRMSGGKQQIHWDDNLPNFGVRVYPTNRKAFVISYRLNGRKHIMTLGAYGVLTLDRARKKAQRELAAVIDGNDPLEKRRSLARGEQVADLCNTYMERHAKVHKKSWLDDQRYINKHILPAVGSVPVKAVQRDDVAKLHGRIGRDRPYAANRILEILAKMFDLAVIWGYVDEGWPNPARRIKKFAEEKRDRWVTPQELPMLARAIDEESNLYARKALWFYLLTGLRKQEVLRLLWSDIDWELREACIGETKSGRKHYLPLSDPALILLEKLPRVEGNPYVFPGDREGQHLVNINKPWRRVRDRATVKLWAADDAGETSKLVAKLTNRLGREPTRKEVEEAATFDLPIGIADVRLHDLRRTVGSWLAQAGNSLHLIGRVLNHSTTDATQVYARFAQDHVRVALENHARQLFATVNGTQTETLIFPATDSNGGGNE